MRRFFTSSSKSSSSEAFASASSNECDDSVYVEHVPPLSTSTKVGNPLHSRSNGDEDLVIDPTTRNYGILSFDEAQVGNHSAAVSNANNSDSGVNVFEEEFEYGDSILLFYNSQGNAIDSDENIVENNQYRPVTNYPISKLTETEEKWMEFCKAKLKNDGVNDKLLTMSQNCVISDRYKYRYFNQAFEMNGIIRPKNNNEGLRIKFILTELTETHAMKLIRKIGHTFNFTKGTIFGMFHSALVIGNWYLDWNDNSLAIVRRVSSSKAVFAFDLGIVKDIKQIHACLDKISAVCCEWNGTKTYDNRECNCHHFTQAVLNTLGIVLDEKLVGSAKYYIHNLREYGVCDMTLKLSNELKSIFKGAKKVTFTSHSQLDAFYNLIIDRNPLYFTTEEGRSDEILLKCFDRSFWLRRESLKIGETDEKKKAQFEKKVNQCEPLRNSNGNCTCPFNRFEDCYKVYMDKNSVNSDSLLIGYAPKRPTRD